MAKAIGYMKPDIDPNLRLYIPFNEGVGNVAKDYSQYGNHAQLTDVEWSPDGFNDAGKFNGSSSFGDCGNNASLNITDAITIEARVKLNDLDEIQGIISSGRGHAKNEAYGIWIWYANLGYISGDGINYDSISMSPDPPLEEWIHIAVTRSGTSIQWYLNGATRGSGTLDYTPISLQNSLLVGSLKTVPTHRSLNGTIDEVMIYALALSAAQNAADCYEVVCS